MTDIEQFEKQVAQHASSLSPDQISEFLSQSNTGECVSMSYEVYRGYLERHSLVELVKIAVSRNAIRPADYLNDLLSGAHEVSGSLVDNTKLETEGRPVYFFPAAGIYAAAVSDTEVIDA